MFCRSLRVARLLATSCRVSLPTIRSGHTRSLSTSKIMSKKGLPDMEGARFVDTHTHIDHTLNKFGLPLTAYAQFKADNFPPEYERCVTVCCDLESFEPTKILADAHDDVYAAYSLHPHNAKEYTDEIEKNIMELMKHPKTVACGEMGLDYHYDFSPREVQREVFARQLKMGVSLGKPIIIHTREAEEDTLQILKDHLPKEWKVHIHCFTSSVQFAESILAEFPNSFIGITGVVTFKTAEGVRDVVKLTPLDRLLLETDGPFMAPLPHSGKNAHPGYIPYVAAKIAEIKGVSTADVIRATRENARRMYGI
eukprot:TRINITY_DN9269_c0_g1_i1.p1 TRINITY_DN9269_c0_g1~~TRINITY_DN9269_c0_g1_i1.p1  ORF type:complete len:310 (+),score=66.11 TRINITY_DN9269_c0_g1_i1:1-930(+)